MDDWVFKWIMDECPLLIIINFARFAYYPESERLMIQIRPHQRFSLKTTGREGGAPKKEWRGMVTIMIRGGGC